MGSPKKTETKSQILSLFPQVKFSLVGEGDSLGFGKEIALEGMTVRSQASHDGSCHLLFV